jgi:hypothetical protein
MKMRKILVDVTNTNDSKVEAIVSATNREVSNRVDILILLVG